MKTLNVIELWVLNNLLFIIYFIVPIIIGLCIFYIFIDTHKKYLEIKKNENYNFSVSSFHQYKGVSYLNDSIFIGPAYDDKRPPSRYLNRMIEKGDSIVKNKNSDTIYLYKGPEVFWFIRHFKE